MLQDVIAYAETSMSRRKFILHYFGESFDEKNGEGALMDDNARNPKEKIQASDEVLLVLKVVRDTLEKYKSKEVVRILRGKTNAMISAHKTDERSFFGCGHAHRSAFWHALVRQMVVANLLKKSIEQYGTLLLTDSARSFLQNPQPFEMVLDRDYEALKQHTADAAQKTESLDEVLLSMLKDLRKKEADKHKVPPYIIFQEPSLEDMVVKYPVNLSELSQIHGVGELKAKKYGAPFVALIQDYVESNDIDRPQDLVVKSAGSNSGLKLYIIQGVDRKLSFEDIAVAKGLSQGELLDAMEQIVFSGTKLNISYWVDELLDDDSQLELYDYFKAAKDNSIEKALQEFGTDYEEEELRIYRLKFYSDVAI